MSAITIIDYGMGNLRSVQKALERVGHPALVSSDPRAIGQAAALVLPGVGAFGDCMRALQRYRLIEPIRQALACGKPFLGICLGLQVLFSESQEFGSHQGLGIIAGTVRRFPAGLKVPHMGWNSLQIKAEAPILQGLPPQPYFYFVHSYYVVPEDPRLIAATTTYGQEFVSMIWKDNIYAVQFHPEKSQTIGLQVLKRFAELACNQPPA